MSNAENKQGKRFYVYLLCKPSGKPFYVGKGTRNRVDMHEREAQGGCGCHKCRTIRKIQRQGKQIVKQIIFETDNEIQAYKYESDLIDTIGLCFLTNQKPGSAWHVNQYWNVRAPHSPMDLSEGEYCQYLRRASRNAQEFKEQLHTWRLDKRRMLRNELAHKRHWLSGLDTTDLELKIAELNYALGIEMEQQMFDFDGEKTS